jgi:MoxR-like ATPase
MTTLPAHVPSSPDHAAACDGRTTPDPAQISADLRAVVEELSARYWERTGVVRSLVIAMLAGQHSLLLGPPGTAKSALARELTSRITGARYYEMLLSKFVDPKRIFGPVDVAALMEGQYRQMFEGRATQAHIAFFDEIFKCSAASLNETLSYLNERLYHPEAGGAPIRCPLISAVTASNELGDQEETAALYDRLLVRLEVGYLADPDNFAAMIRSTVTPPDNQEPPTTVELDDLLAAVSTHVPAVEIGDGLVDTICQIRAQLRHEEIIVSDRRWKAAVRLIQASAYLAGRPAADDNDLLILTTVLWDEPLQRRTVERTVLELVNPYARQGLDLDEAISELEAELNAKQGQSRDELATWAIREATKKLDRTAKKLQRLRADAAKASRSTATLDENIAHCHAVQSRILVEVLGVSATALPTD